MQKFDSVKLETYLSHIGFRFQDDTGAEYRDANSTLFGFRWWF